MPRGETMLRRQKLNGKVTLVMFCAIALISLASPAYVHATNVTFVANAEPLEEGERILFADEHIRVKRGFQEYECPKAEFNGIVIANGTSTAVVEQEGYVEFAGSCHPFEGLVLKIHNETFEFGVENEGRLEFSPELAEEVCCYGGDADLFGSKFVWGNNCIGEGTDQYGYWASEPNQPAIMPFEQSVKSGWCGNLTLSGHFHLTTLSGTPVEIIKE